MIAYKHEWLDNLYFRKESFEALEENCITEEEYVSIHTKYPVGFYTPNIFIRIGLFILTLIILLFSFGLLILISSTNLDSGLGRLAIFFAVLCFIALELMIHFKHHYRSGVDDGLLWGGAVALLCGICLPNDFKELTICIIVFVISFIGSIRYTDKLMIAVAYFSMLGIVFYCCIEMGYHAKTVVPFIVMAISLMIYYLSMLTRVKKDTTHYKECLQTLEIMALISLYAAGNYFVVRELSNEMFNMHLQPGESIPLGWIFWIFTIAIPVIYLVRGIQIKDTTLIRVGLLLLAAIAFTVRYYHTILPLETMMTIGGIILLAIAYVLMKWLHQPVKGFTSQEIVTKNKNDIMQLEALILLQTFKPVPGTDTNVPKFGGGNFGGGGASGDF